MNDYGKYGLMRLKYIKQHKPVYYTALLTNGTLDEHLKDVNDRAKKLVNNEMERLIEQNSIPDKATHQIEWVQCMNNLKSRAEEIVCKEIIYI